MPINKLKPSFSPDPRDFDRMLTFRLGRVADSLAAGTLRSYLRKHELTIAEWRVLMIVARFGHLTANEVSRGATMDKGWVSRAVAGLLKRKLLKKTADENDQRKQILSPTREGKALYDRIRPISRKRQEQILALLTAEEQKVLDRILTKLQAFADTYPGN